MNTRKFWVFVFILVLLIVLSAINLRVVSSSLINPDRIGNIITQLVGAKINVSKTDFSLWRGLQLSDFKLSMTSTPQTEIILLSAKNIGITPDRLKLINGEFIISEIVLNQPELDWNYKLVAQLFDNLKFSDIYPSEYNAKFKQPPKKIQPKINIINGSAYIRDINILSKDTSAKLSDINISLHPIGINRYLIEGEFKLGLMQTQKTEYFSGDWRINGEINLNSGLVHLKISISGLEIGENLSNKLSDKFKNIWNTYQIQGKINLNIDYSYNLNTKSNDFTVQMDCLDNEIIYKNFPYKTTNIKGQVSFSKSGIQLKKISAYDPRNGGNILLDGQVDGYELDSGFTFNISANNIILDNKLLDTTPRSIKEIWSNLAITKGNLDISGIISRPDGPNKTEEYNLKLLFKDVEFSPIFFPYTVVNSDADIEVSIKNNIPTEVKIKSLGATRQSGTNNETKSNIHLSGSFYVMPNNEYYQFSVEAKNIQTNDYALKEAVKKHLPDAEKLWITYQPAGLVNLNVLISKQPGDKQADTQLSIECNNNSIKLDPSFYQLSSLKGQIDYIPRALFKKESLENNTYDFFLPEQITDKQLGNKQKDYSKYREMPVLCLKHLRACNDKASFDFDGVIINPFSKSEKPVFLLSIQASQVDLSHQLLELLPEPIGSFLKDIELKGNSNMLINITNPNFNRDTINYHAEVKLSNGSFRIGLLLNEINGSVTIKGQVQGDSQQGHTAGSIQINHLRIEDKQFSNLSIQFLREKNRFSFYDINGAAYGGTISGYTTVELPTKQNTGHYKYYGQVNLVGLDIRSIGRDTTLVTSDISGKLSAELTIGGNGITKEDISIQGHASIVDAQLWEVPIFLSIFNLFTLSEKSAFHEGEVKFSMKGGKINVTRLIFTSKSVTLKGAGTIKLDGSLDLQFDTQFAPWFLPNIKLLKDITNLFTQGIYTIKVEGSFSEPKAILKPLPLILK
ncbi:MAG: hypothetical protein V1701_09155 [Planctomycetota bacterium]